MKPRPRILVVTEERGLAETVQGALSAISELRPDLEVTLAPERALPLIRERGYQLLVLASEKGATEAESLVADLPEGQAVVIVAGRPNEATGAHRRVPLPLSFNLLRDAVLAALRGDRAEGDEGAPRLRDSVGS